MYRNSLFSKVVDIAINWITSPDAVAHGGPFGQTKTQIFEMKGVNSAANFTTTVVFLVKRIRKL